MRNYSDNSASVRVDFFKEKGKWYTTEAVDMNRLWSNDPNDYWPPRFEQIVKKHLNGRLKGMWAVCLDPYHPNAWPYMFKIED